MNKKSLVFILCTFSQVSIAGPVLQMNQAFNSLMEIIPDLNNASEFQNKKNEKRIETSMQKMSSAFKTARHDYLINHDLFAPSYKMINENVADTGRHFKGGRKEYSRWLLKETVSLCIDCHTRLPDSYSSSFQDGHIQLEKNKFNSPYDLGVAQLLVRRYSDAKDSFIRNFQDDLIKGDKGDLIHPLQQILLIETKVLRNPDGMLSRIDDWLKKKLPQEVSAEMNGWKKRLLIWKDEKSLKQGLANDKEVQKFITGRLVPLKNESYEDAFKVDLLFGSGILSHYFFENQESTLKPELSFWLGWIEKRLKKEHFFSSGDLFLKQCMIKYPKHSIARSCFEEYKESVEFDFSGSSGTHIPASIQKELKELKEKIKI
jgi:hypothetical protein